MKKVVALVLILCFIFCSCGIKEKAEDIIGNIVPEEEPQYTHSINNFNVFVPGAIGYNMIFPQNVPETVDSVFEDAAGNGYIISLKTRSDFSSDDMLIDVAISSGGEICDIELKAYYESKDFGADYPESYIGQDSSLSGVDLVAGTTYSSKAFKNAIEDAFEVLIENGLAAEGKKDEEQLVSETIPLALPGCVGISGNALITPVEGFSDPFIDVYKANNGCGYIYVMVGGSYGIVVVGVNAFGDAKVYSLDGDDITEDCEGIAEDAASAAPIIAKENLEYDIVKAKSLFGGNAVITPIEDIKSFSDVTAVFEIESNGKTNYAVFTKTFGYGDEVMEIAVVLDEKGEIVFCDSFSGLMLHGEYYADHDLKNEQAYLNSFIGLSENTFSEDGVLVAGATMSSNAVLKAIQNAFEVFNLL